MSQTSKLAYRLHNDVYIPTVRRGRLCISKGLIIRYLAKLDLDDPDQIFQELNDRLYVQEYVRNCYICVNPYATPEDLDRIVSEIEKNYNQLVNPHVPTLKKYSILVWIIYAAALLRYLGENSETDLSQIEDRLLNIVIKCMQHLDMNLNFLKVCMPRLNVLIRYAKRLIGIELRSSYYRRF